MNAGRQHASQAFRLSTAYSQFEFVMLSYDAAQSQAGYHT